MLQLGWVACRGRRAHAWSLLSYRAPSAWGLPAQPLHCYYGSEKLSFFSFPSLDFFRFPSLAQLGRQLLPTH